MPEITDISPQVKDKERCNIYIDGRFYCGMKLETVLRNRLKAGEQIEISRLDELQLENERSEALDKGMKHLSVSMKTEKEMRDFLKKKGYVEAVIDFVIEKLTGYGFLNDEEYAKAYIQSNSRKKGRLLLSNELKRRGLQEEEIDTAMESLSGEKEAAAEILKKYMKSKDCSKENLYKAFRYLLSKGFEYETAKDALSDFAQDTEQDSGEDF